MNEELLKKARGARSAAELKALAAEAGNALTDEQAEAYYAHLNKSGALTDEELDNVAGGGCHKSDGRLIVTVGHSCKGWACKVCGSGKLNPMYGNGIDTIGVHSCGGVQRYMFCKNCKYMSYEHGLWLCNNPANRE